MMNSEAPYPSQAPSSFSNLAIGPAYVRDARLPIASKILMPHEKLDRAGGVRRGTRMPRYRVPFSGSDALHLIAAVGGLHHQHVRTSVRTAPCNSPCSSLQTSYFSL